MWALAGAVSAGGVGGSITRPCDADACGHPLQSCPVSQESFRAQTLLSLHKRHDHYNREKRGTRVESCLAQVSCPHMSM